MEPDVAHAGQGYSAKLTADVVGITYRQLDYWARTDLVTPSHAQATGSGSRRRYSYDDLVRLKVIKRLLDSGIKLEKVRAIFDYVRNELQEDISSAGLVIDGANAAIVRGQDELIDALQKGQGVLPLSNIGREVDAAIIEFRPSADVGDGAIEADEEDLQTAIGES